MYWIGSVTGLQNRMERIRRGISNAVLSENVPSLERFFAFSCLNLQNMHTSERHGINSSKGISSLDEDGFMYGSLDGQLMEEDSLLYLKSDFSRSKDRASTMPLLLIQTFYSKVQDWDLDKNYIIVKFRKWSEHLQWIDRDIQTL